MADCLLLDFIETYIAGVKQTICRISTLKVFDTHKKY